MYTRLIPALLLIMAFAVPAFGQTTATDWFNIGMELYNQDNFTGSLEAYNKVLDIDPLDSQAWNNKGIDLGMLGRYDEALHAFGNATKINSSYAEAWYNAGVIYDFQGDLVSAIHAYNKATEIDPSYQKALVSRSHDSDIVLAPSLSCSCSKQIPLL